MKVKIISNIPEDDCIKCVYSCIHPVFIPPSRVCTAFGNKILVQDKGKFKQCKDCIDATIE